MIRGPALDMTVRRKERILGIWVNREQVVFSGPCPDTTSSPARGRSTTSPRCQTQERFPLGHGQSRNIVTARASIP